MIKVLKKFELMERFWDMLYFNLCIQVLVYSIWREGGWTSSSAWILTDLFWSVEERTKVPKKLERCVACCRRSCFQIFTHLINKCRHSLLTALWTITMERSMVSPASCWCLFFGARGSCYRGSGARWEGIARLTSASPISTHQTCWTCDLLIPLQKKKKRKNRCAWQNWCSCVYFLQRIESHRILPSAKQTPLLATNVCGNIENLGNAMFSAHHVSRHHELGLCWTARCELWEALPSFSLDPCVAVDGKANDLGSSRYQR